MGKNAFTARSAGAARNFKKLNIFAMAGELGNLDGKTPSEIRELLSMHTTLKGAALMKAAQSYVEFISAPNGSLLISPNSAENTVDFAILDGDYTYDANADFPHKRAVQWMTTEEVHRNRLSQQLRKSLRMNRIFYDISQHFDEICALSSGVAYSPKTLNISVLIREGIVINIEVPSDLTRQEALKLSDALRSNFAVED